MSNPRIYFAIPTFHPLVGGVETQTLAQARNLRERGYAATVITFRHNKTWVPGEVIQGVPVIRVAGALLGGREKLPRPIQRLLYLLALLIMGWEPLSTPGGMEMRSLLCCCRRPCPRQSWQGVRSIRPSPPQLGQVVMLTTDPKIDWACRRT